MVKGVKLRVTEMMRVNDINPAVKNKLREGMEELKRIN